MFGELLAPQYLRWLLDGFLLTLGLALLSCLLATLIGAPGHRPAVAPAPAVLAGARLPGAVPQYPAAGAAVLLVLRRSRAAAGGAGELAEHAARDALARLAVLRVPRRCLGLTLYTSAFVAEEFRAGIASVRPEQRAAGLALGLTQRQVWRVVVLPQALRTALPPLLGQYMNALKNSSLAMAIGLAELSYASRQVETETFKTFQAFGIATLLYIGAIALIEAFGQALQQTRRYRQGGA